MNLLSDTLVVVPTFNEIATIDSIIARILAAVPDSDILIVDDESPDGTGLRADELAECHPRVSVLHRTARRGLGMAYIAAFERAIESGYSYVVEIDADGSHDPAELPGMLETARGGVDLVIGSRWVDGGSTEHWPAYRRGISRTGNRYARALLRSSIQDITAGFRVYSTSALSALDFSTVSSQGYCFQVELAWRIEKLGFTVAERPIVFTERTEGRSKMHAGIVAEALVRVTGWGLSERFTGVRRR